MAREIELKFQLAEPAEMRAKLGTLAAHFVSKAFEVNRIFDTATGKLKAKGHGLRVRTSTCDGERPPEARLTFKGPRAAGAFKSREELELTVTDAETLVAILGQLGFQEVIRYEKRRETWTLDDCEIVLDELPRTGWWIEIEAESEQAVSAVRERLGLTDTPVAAQTYVAMATKEGRRAADGSARLVFES